MIFFGITRTGRWTTLLPFFPTLSHNACVRLKRAASLFFFFPGHKHELSSIHSVSQYPTDCFTILEHLNVFLYYITFRRLDGFWGFQIVKSLDGSLISSGSLFFSPDDIRASRFRHDTDRTYGLGRGGQTNQMDQTDRQTDNLKRQ